MKKGFTLIELLAVIVILAIIALISTPLILNVIEDAKKGAFKNTAYGIIEAAELEYAKNKLSGINEEIIHTYQDGQETSENKLEFKGKKPQNGKVIIGESGDISLAIHDGKYCAYKNYAISSVVVQVMSVSECEEKTTLEYTDSSCFTFDKSKKMILKYDFDNCSKNVVIPEEIDGVQVEHIGPAAFADAYEQRCQIYDQETGNLISNEAVDFNHVHTEGDGHDRCFFRINYSSTKNITSVKLPHTLKTIRYDAFSGSHLSEVIIPYGVTTIEDSAFSATLLTKVIFPDTLVTIGEMAFEDCNISDLTLPNSIKKIGNSAFATNNLSDITIPSSITVIEGWVFSHNKFTSITIPSSVTKIEEYAFYDNKLTSINIPDSVTTVETGAFYWNNLQTITIGKGLIDMKANPFGANRNLVSITVSNENPMYKSEGNVVYTKDGTTLVVGSKQISNSIPQTVTKIGKLAFHSCELTSITIPSSVTIIEEYAFYANNLTSVFVPSNVTTIGNYAFASNKITEGNGQIDNRSANVNLGVDIFKYNGANGQTTIAPTFLGDI